MKATETELWDRIGRLTEDEILHLPLPELVARLDPPSPLPPTLWMDTSGRVHGRPEPEPEYEIRPTSPPTVRWVTGIDEVPDMGGYTVVRRGDGEWFTIPTYPEPYR